jgi:Sulfatase-modifying factor enzyme 1
VGGPFLHPPAAAQTDDVLLPLPCGGSIAFRPVVTPPETRDALADMAVQLGRDEQSTGFIDYFRREHLLGSLSRPDGSWYFLIGKFTVTIDQWNAVMQPNRCVAPSDAGLLPKADVSWFDAVDYGRRLTEWLLHDNKNSLPREGNETSYLRLPTEVEWEFAARGGIAVGKAQLAAERFFPDGEPISAYVVIAEPGRPHVARPVGSRKPNPLGLYDMLGNVEQWVLDPFHANRQGRDHGESGGFVTRGGSYETAQAGIRTSLRSEYPAYDLRTGAAWRHPKIGFRLVVAAPVLFSAQRTDALQAAWIELSKSGGRTTEGNEVVPGLDRIASDSQDPALRANLDSLKHEVLVERGRRDEVEAHLFRSAMLNGALLVRGLRQDLRLATVLQGEIPYWSKKLDEARNSKDQPRIQQYERVLNDINSQYSQADERRQLATRGYTDAIVQLAQNAQANQQETQRDQLTRELNASGLGALVPHLSRFDSALSVYRARPEMGTEALVRLIAEDGLGSH